MKVAETPEMEASRAAFAKAQSAIVEFLGSHDVVRPRTADMDEALKSLSSSMASYAYLLSALAFPDLIERIAANASAMQYAMKDLP